MRILLCLSAILLLVWAPAGAGSQVFIDLDGDGFNDNSPDLNGDGIPDELAPGYVAPADNTSDAGIFAGMEFQAVEAPVLPETAKEGFGRLSFSTRSISKFRSAFDSDFGSGLGFSVGGSACAGGVCR